MRATGQTYRFHAPVAKAWKPVPAKPDLPPALVQALRQWTRPRTVWQKLECAVSGHEKWTTPNGDWACMRCGKIRCASAPRESRGDADR